MFSEFGEVLYLEWRCLKKSNLIRQQWSIMTLLVLIDPTDARSFKDNFPFSSMKTYVVTPH